MEKIENIKLEYILRRILLEWKFLGLSKEKLEEKISSKYEEGNSDETSSKKY
ncbi:hypothetical protein [Gemella cuniculi]|uniref:hypothetical protein n=1 Tax=Gemella cuniculi TaxID=150240 RepID=UPI00041046BF|nr:hypothetical protein [Gemella cuniculi]